MLNNPDKKFAKSQGTDLPLMYVYLAGRIAGNCINECLDWRYRIINYYRDYKGRGLYPISFLDALNSKESDSIDAKGLTSAIPPNLIYDKDLLSVKRADVVVANLDDFLDINIRDLLAIPTPDEYGNNCPYPYESFNFKEAFFKLRDTIVNRRPNYGTICEVAWALYLNKPIILIASDKKQKEMLSLHPFTRRASVIVDSVDTLLEYKWLNILYKSISSATY